MTREAVVKEIVLSFSLSLFRTFILSRSLALSLSLAESFCDTLSPARSLSMFWVDAWSVLLSAMGAFLWFTSFHDMLCVVLKINQKVTDVFIMHTTSTHSYNLFLHTNLKVIFTRKCKKKGMKFLPLINELINLRGID